MWLSQRQIVNGRVRLLLPPSSLLWDPKSQVVLKVKNLPANAGDVRDVGLIPESGRSPGGGHGNPLQYSCLGNPMDRGDWRATVHRFTKSWTLRDLARMHVRPHHIWDITDHACSHGCCQRPAVPTAASPSAAHGQVGLGPQ